MKTFIVPTDFSENAGDAFRYALELVGTEPVKIHVVNCLTPAAVQAEYPIPMDDRTLTYIKDAQLAMEGLESYVDMYLERNPKKQVEYIGEVEIGSVVERVNTLADELNADLIVMGTRGVNHSGFDRRIGTISTALLQGAPCPVLLVPGGYEFQPLDQLLFATNLDHGDPYEMWRAEGILPLAETEITFLYVAPKGEEEATKQVRQLEDFLDEKIGERIHFQVTISEDIDGAIARCSEEYNAKMVIMPRRDRSFLQRLFSASHTKAMVSKLTMPLLVMNPEKVMA